jgi:RNA polymerase sigma factor for flagellar operon FliA
MSDKASEAMQKTLFAGLNKPSRKSKKALIPSGQNRPGEIRFEDKDAFLIANMPLVEIIVKKMISNLPKHISYDDLMSAGKTGLMKAYDKYNQSHEAQATFQNYAKTHVWGNILDYLREEDKVSRTTRGLLKKRAVAVEQLEKSLGRPPSEEEVRNFLGISQEDYHTHITHGEVFEFSFDDFATPPNGEKGDSRLDKTALALDMSSETESPESITTNAEIKKIVMEKLREIPDAEAAVVSLYYFDELTLKEIATILGTTQARVSKLRNRGLQAVLSSLKKEFSSLRY